VCVQYAYASDYGMRIHPWKREGGGGGRGVCMCEFVWALSQVRKAFRSRVQLLRCCMLLRFMLIAGEGNWSLWGKIRGCKPGGGEGVEESDVEGEVNRAMRMCGCG
jgi:hypothetical protein